jgi:plastocyanin
VQTTIVLLNLIPIALIMIPGFYGYVDYVIADGVTTTRGAALMIGHALLGLAVEVYAIYLVVRMRTSWIPARWRVRNIGLAMRATLALWVVVVLIGVGMYADRYVFQRVPAVAPLLEFRQLGADLYVHAVELDDAEARASLAAVKRHAEHLINLIEGEEGLHYGDNDIDGHLEDPGDGIGLLARLETVATIANDPALTARADALREQLDKIVARSLDLLGAQGLEGTAQPVTEILDLASQANGQGVFAIDFAAREAGVAEAPPLVAASEASGGVTIAENLFDYIPSAVTIPAGTTVTWRNDERAKHTATADDGLFDTGDQDLGVSASYTFSEPGVYRYYCRYHGDVGGVGMAGTITVE